MHSGDISTRVNRKNTHLLIPEGFVVWFFVVFFFFSELFFRWLFSPLLQVKLRKSIQKGTPQYLLY